MYNYMLSKKVGRLLEIMGAREAGAFQTGPRCQSLRLAINNASTTRTSQHSFTCLRIGPFSHSSLGPLLDSGPGRHHQGLRSRLLRLLHLLLVEGARRVSTRLDQAEPVPAPSKITIPLPWGLNGGLEAV